MGLFDKQGNTSGVVLADRKKEFFFGRGGGGDRVLVAERLAEGAGGSTVTVVDGFIETTQIVNTDNNMFSQGAVVKVEHFLDRGFTGVGSGREGDKLDRMNVLGANWEDCQHMFEPGLGILFVHFDDPCTSGDITMVGNEAGYKLKGRKFGA